MAIFWLRLKSSLVNSWWWTYLAKEHREKHWFDFTPEEVDDMWDDDTIDIKNFSHMDPGSAKKQMYKMLVERRNWYIQQGLSDWAEQIDTALWLDKENHVGSKG